VGGAEHNLLLDGHYVLELSLLVLLIALIAQQLDVNDLQFVEPAQFAHPVLWDLEILLGLDLLTHLAAYNLRGLRLLLLPESFPQVPHYQYYH